MGLGCQVVVAAKVTVAKRWQKRKFDLALANC